MYKILECTIYTVLRVDQAGQQTDLNAEGVPITNRADLDAFIDTLVEQGAFSPAVAEELKANGSDAKTVPVIEDGMVLHSYVSDGTGCRERMEDEGRSINYGFALGLPTGPEPGLGPMEITWWGTRDAAMEIVPDDCETWKLVSLELSPWPWPGYGNQL